MAGSRTALFFDNFLEHINTLPSLCLIVNSPSLSFVLVVGV